MERLSIGSLETPKHREVTDVRCQQLGVEEQGGGGDHVVGVVDSAVCRAVLANQRTGGSCDILIDCDPGHCREELLERFELVVSYASKEFKSNNLAGGDGLVFFHESPQETSCGFVAAQMVDSDRRIDELHSRPRRLRRSLRSPRIESTYSVPVKRRPRHEPALAWSA